MSKGVSLILVLSDSVRDFGQGKEAPGASCPGKEQGSGGLFDSGIETILTVGPQDGRAGHHACFLFSKTMLSRAEFLPAIDARQSKRFANTSIKIF
jgi:hypothetical protein